LEKEARLVLNEILAKLNQNEKMVGGGAIVVAVGWLLGLVLTSWYGASGAQGLGFVAVAAAVAAIVVIYLKYAPNMKIAWPAPITLIILVIAAVAAIAALLGLLEAFTYDPYGGLGAYCNLAGAACPTKPVTLYLAAAVVLVGGAVMAYGAYMEYSTNKTPAA
jgi:amino acid transporter